MKKIILILVIALALRLVNLNQSLWLDEAISALAARDLSYFDIVFNFLRIDNHPPIFYLLLKFWGSIFGFNDLALRILPVLLGVGLVFAVYKLTENLTKNPKTAFISGLFTAASPFLIYYSQEIRMYILIALLSAIQIFIFQKILNKEKAILWFLFSVFNCLLFFSDYITVFLIPVFIIYPLLKKNPKLFSKVLFSYAPLGILFIFWFPVFNGQLLKNKEIINSFPGWQFIVGGATFKNLAVAWMKFVLGRISFEPKIAYYFLILLASLPLTASLYLASKKLKNNLLIWLWLAVPLFLGFIFSFIIPVFNYFRFIYVLPAMLILVSIGISQLKNTLLQNILIIAVLLTNLAGLLIYYLDPAQSRENWKQAVSFIEEKSKKDDLIVFEFHEQIAPFRWYSTGKIDAIGATDSYFADPIKTPQKLEQALSGKSGVYHFEYLRDLTDPQKYVEQKLEAENFKKVDVLTNFYNIGHITYWKR